MKYENFKQVKNIVEQIDKLQMKYDAISNDETEIIIANDRNGRVYTIGTWSSCEHEYAEPSRLLIATIKLDLAERITNLKSNLELL